jgi:hypothetical protein
MHGLAKAPVHFKQFKFGPQADPAIGSELVGFGATRAINRHAPTSHHKGRECRRSPAAARTAHTQSSKASRMDLAAHNETDDLINRRSSFCASKADPELVKDPHRSQCDPPALGRWSQARQGPGRLPDFLRLREPTWLNRRRREDNGGSPREQRHACAIVAPHHAAKDDPGLLRSFGGFAPRSIGHGARSSSTVAAIRCRGDHPVRVTLLHFRLLMASSPGRCIACAAGGRSRNISRSLPITLPNGRLTVLARCRRA